MKKLGLIGGTSWVSTIDYYKYINEGVNKKLGGNEFAECIIYSLNYGDIIRLGNAGQMEKVYELLFEGCTCLKNSGAAAIVLCANTMHQFAGRIQKDIDLPLIHIAEATAISIQNQGLKKVGLLGTKFTMKMDFFKDKLAEYGIETLIPDEADMDHVHEKIHSELLRGLILQDTKQKYLDIIQKLISHGAEGIILGCTEIPLLIKQEDVSVPAFDTTLIHANAAVDFALDISH